jgi:hypothetical protein
VSHHHESKKKLKKALQFKKNRMLQEIFNLLRIRRAEEERVKQQEEDKKPKSFEKGDDHEWGDKVSVVRNRLTDKKRVSRERWNRFAGTASGGGRGL